jgi:hypothetical protein
MRTRVTTSALHVLALVVAVAGPSVACGGDDTGGAHQGTGGTATAGGAGISPLAGSGGEPATSGAGRGGTTSGGIAGNAQAGSGGQLSGEQLREATYGQCDDMCRLVKEACAESNLKGCTDACHQQADNYAATGQCAAELYRTATCVNETQTVAEITCAPSGPEFAGCQTELAAYNACVGG